MLLSSLIANKGTPLSADPDITSLCADSRHVVAGALFFAQRGAKDSGMRYVASAISNGAVAIVVPDDAPVDDIPNNIPVIRVPEPRALIATCAARLYPRQPSTIVAVTGTSGKTSTTYFVQQIFNMLGKRSVSIGTLGLAGLINEYGSLTTPEAPELHQTLDRLAHDNINHVSIEASSQALVQHRMDAVHIQVAAFTNLTRDHLDYHGTMEDYLAAKKILFSRILPVNGTAVLNADDDVYDELRSLAEARGQRVMSYGTKGTDIRLTKHRLIHDGQHLEVMVNDKAYTLNLSVAGEFQAANILCAIGMCIACDLNIDDILRVAGGLKAPPGRLQPVAGHPAGAAIYVDYAHKPDALQSVLKGLRAHNPRKLVCVFGCGGDRDPGKRTIMGDIAARLADDVIVTDDNPRTENAAAIRATIISAAPRARDIGDRAAAIQTAVSELQAGDILLIAGKGHETGQIFADHTEPFDDVAVVQAAINTLPSVTR